MKEASHSTVASRTSSSPLLYVHSLVLLYLSYLYPRSLASYIYSQARALVTVSASQPSLSHRDPFYPVSPVALSLPSSPCLCLPVSLLFFFIFFYYRLNSVFYSSVPEEPLSCSYCVLLPCLCVSSVALVIASRTWISFLDLGYLLVNFYP